jgi:hypothetical protein
MLRQLSLALGLGVAGLACWAAQSTAPPMSAEAKAVIVIQAYNDGLAGVRASNPVILCQLFR